MSDDLISSTVENGQDFDSSEKAGSVRKKLKVDCDSSANGDLLVGSVACSSTTNHNNSCRLTINQTYCDKINDLKKLYNSASVTESDNQIDSFVTEKCQIVREPFQVIQLKQFVHDAKSLHSLKKAISTVDLSCKNNDLYRLKQSNDLSNYPQFDSVCDFFKNDVRSFLQDLTDTTLNSNVALTISRYDENDYLLCHDDQLDNRKIAFILYLVEQDWMAEDGGQLELFQCNSDDHQPLEIVKRLTPEWNLFNFFIVQPFTYHQVSEVKTSKSPRWSINGWFHSNTVTVVPRNYSFPLISKIRHPILLQTENSISYEVLLSWINPRYTVDEMQQEIQDNFVDNSEIALPNFLRDEKFYQLADALSSITNLKLWERNFRPVLANYEYIPDELISPDEEGKQNQASQSDDSLEMPNIIREAFKLFYSEAFFLVLSNLTGIRLHKKAVINDDDDDDDEEEEEEEEEDESVNENKPDCVSMCRGEVRRWQVGDFTLASSIAPEYSENKALDFMFFLNVNEKKDNHCETIDVNETAEPTAGPSRPAVSSSSSKANNEQEMNADSNGTINLSSGSNSDEDSDIIDLSEEESDLDNDEPLDQERERAGGYITYIDESTTDDLLTIEPISNCLNMVYRMRGTQRFMKYITAQNANTPFNEISIVYYQQDSIPK